MKMLLLLLIGILLFSCKGEDGLVGPQGEQGLQGEKGLQGDVAQTW